MSTDLLPLAIEHVEMHTRCMKGAPVLLLLDSHENDVSIEAVQKAKESGICLFTLACGMQ